MTVAGLQNPDFAFQRAWNNELNQNLQDVLNGLRFPPTDVAYTLLRQNNIISNNEYADIVDERNGGARAQLLYNVLSSRDSVAVGNFIAILARNVGHQVLASELTIMYERARNAAGLPHQV